VQRTILSQPATGALRLLLFTGCRLREILHLRWADIDFEARCAASARQQNRKAVCDPERSARAVLTGLPRVSEYVIAGVSRISLGLILKDHGGTSVVALVVGVRLHDLRHTHASIGAGAGLGLPVIGKLLGHATPTTTSRYAHLDNDPLRRASEQIGARLSAAVSDSRTANNLVQINPARLVP
jgi:integrase